MQVLTCELRTKIHRYRQEAEDNLCIIVVCIVGRVK